MKFSLCNELYKERTIFEVIESVARLGYDGLEVAPFTLTEDIPAFPLRKQREIARCAAENGIEVLGLHWLLSYPEGLHVVSRDDKVRRKTRDYFLKFIEIAVNTGGTLLTLGSPGQRSFGEGDTQGEALKRLTDFLSGLLPDLESNRVTVCLEPLEAELTNLLNRTQEACGVADSLGSSSIGITLDAHFMRWEKEHFGTSEREAFKIAGPRLRHLHIQDDNSRAPGTGNADFSEYVQGVRDINWEGFISMETFASEEGEEGEDIAKAGIAFFKENFFKK
ncbi:MAG TPA: sugar phosphate isomerase/epimerase family protein [Spirochaetia bacterium]|nr:sugar phosphate isomerase/epimerase family protein [Spirochaetia bacterium]